MKLKDFTHNLKPIYLLIQFICNKLTESSITQYVSALDQNTSKFMKFTEWNL